ncbi:MAG TPA: hypothetical protein VM889_04170 [Candidatus Thermoplasmatota archaeon]|nr:hypothetical protein [Candidatus Thermoplasmatota archaeon]
MSVRVPSGFVLVLALALAAVLAGCVTGTSRWYVEVDYEADEANREALNAAGQANCVREAAEGIDSPTCPRVPTGGLYPIDGIRLLDGFVTFLAGPTSASADAQDVFTMLGGGPMPEHIVSDQARGANAHRASNGFAPDVVWPGPMSLKAAYGYWGDTNGDRIVAINLSENAEHASPDNEWVGLANREVYVYVEPGSHPQYRSMIRPGDTQPDARLRASSRGLYDTGIVPVIFTDGSLVQTYTITTIADAILSPSPDGEFPYTMRADSLVDIDVYGAVAPGPVEALYTGTAAPLVNAIGSPSYGICPAGCSGLPIGPTETAADPTIAAAQNALYARYPREWADGSGSTAEGRRAAFEDAYEGWIDLLPRTRVKPVVYQVNIGNELPPFTTDAPLVGHNTADGEQAAAPGFVTFDLWVGIWRDLNGDGFIGRANADDPYEAGSRPLPDDYFARDGEFFGAVANLTTFTLWLVPDTEWGPNGARVARSLGALPDQKVYVGSEPVPLTMHADHENVAAGHYASRLAVFLADGSPGFTVCTPWLTVRYAEGGLDVTQVVRDCDHVAPWAE